MRCLNFLMSIIDSTSNWVGRVISFAIFAVGVVILVTIVARAIDQPANWTFETTYYLFGSYFLLAGAYALLQHGHIKVDILYRRLSPRVGAIVNLFTWLFFFMFAGAMFWGGTEMALRSVSIQEKFATIWAPPLYPLKIMIPLGALLILLQGVAHFIRDFKTAAGKSREQEIS